MDRLNLKDYLQHGDISRIAKTTGVSRRYVSYILNGDRGSRESPKYKKVMAAIEAKVEHNQQFDQLANPNPNPLEKDHSNESGQ
jgi:transcriptional regulator with XRE-family HTH domain